MKTKIFALLFILCAGLLMASCSAADGAPGDSPTANTSNVKPLDEPTPVPPRQATAAPQATRVPPTATQASAQPAPTDTPAASTNNTFRVSADPYITDLKEPVLITSAHDGSGRLYIVEQGGRILLVENGRILQKPFLDVSGKITTQGNEQGLLGLAFHPDYKNNGHFFINYSQRGSGDNVIARYQVSSDANAADANSEKSLLIIPGLESNHNGGMMAFGPDGYLYIGTGDGGGAGDRHGAIGNGQSRNTFLGKMLRLDVNVDPYQIPANNPFVGQSDVKPEIWAYGLRNPWRFSFDRATGDLYIADVGQNAFEEVNFQAAQSKGGENYGWRLMEAMHCFNPAQNCNNGDLVKPIVEYPHDFGCSISGGYVYRGKMYPWLVGQYLFADYCTGIVWASTREANGEWKTRQVGKFDDTISAFGEDEAGELYVVGHGNGVIYKLTSAQ